MPWSTALLAAWCVLLALAPASATAVCIDRCFCGGQTPEGVFTGTITSGSENAFEARVDQTFGATGLTVGETTTVSGFGTLTTGDRVFVHVTGGTSDTLLTLEADGQVSCGNLDLSVVDAAELSLSSDCVTRRQDLGFVAPPCDDTPGGCSHGSGGAGLAFLGLALVALERRGRRAAAAGRASL